MIAYFANTSMSPSLCDAINHAGLIAQHNVKIRHRLEVDSKDGNERAKIPSAFRSAVLHYNHTRLALINQLAETCGIICPVFNNVRPLPEDNGEKLTCCYASTVQAASGNNAYGTIRATSGNDAVLLAATGTDAAVGATYKYSAAQLLSSGVPHFLSTRC